MLSDRKMVGRYFEHARLLRRARRDTGNRREGIADFPYMLKAAFGRGRLRAGSLRSPVLAGQHQDDGAVRSQLKSASRCRSESG
jgi:hypothetical protein